MPTSLFQERNSEPWKTDDHMKMAKVPQISTSCTSMLQRMVGLGVQSQHDFKLYVLEHWSPLGAYLSAQDLHHLARACHVVNFREGGRLHESPFYIVVEGTVSVFSAEEALPTERELCRRGAGAFFTRRAGEGHVRARAPTPASESRRQSFSERVTHGEAEHVTELLGSEAGKVLLVSSDDRIDDFGERCTPTGRDGFESIVSTNLSTVLSDVPFIHEAHLTSGALRSLAELCSYETAAAGAFVFEQGDSADAFYIVLKGSVEAVINEGGLVDSHESAEGEEVGGVVRGAGDTFGVASLLLRAKTRTYGMRATERSLLLHVSFEKFLPFLFAHRSLERSLVCSTMRFLLQRYSRLKTSIFHSMTPEELERVGELAHFHHVEKGDVVYAAGDRAKEFYVVVHGEFIRDYGEGVNLPQASRQKTLGLGSYFGEVGLLLQRTPMLATVTAMHDSTLLTVPKSSFMEIMGSNAKIKLELCIRVHKRDEVPLELILLHPKIHPMWVDFAVAHLRGGLRLPVHNAAAKLLRKARASTELIGPQGDGVAVETVVGIMNDVLYAHALELAHLIRTTPTPRVDDLLSHAQRIISADTGGSSIKIDPELSAPAGGSINADPKLSSPVNGTIKADPELSSPMGVTDVRTRAGPIIKEYDEPLRTSGTELVELLRAQRDAEKLLVRAIDEGVKRKATRDSRSNPEAHTAAGSFVDIQRAIKELCERNEACLRAAHAAFITSEIYTATLVDLGGYDQGVRKLIHENDLADLISGLLPKLGLKELPLRNSSMDPHQARALEEVWSPLPFKQSHYGNRERRQELIDRKGDSSSASLFDGTPAGRRRGNQAGRVGIAASPAVQRV